MSAVDVMAVLEAFLEVVPLQIAEGNIVRLGDFGSFNLTINGTSSDKEEDVSVNNISGNSLKFLPGK